MKKILNNLDYEIIIGNLNANIMDIVIDSRNANENSLFVCLIGAKTDGHNYIENAYNQGCRNFLVEKDVGLDDYLDATFIKVSDTRKCLSLIAQNFYNHPSKSLTTIAITGTKGKTTTAQMIKEIIEATGKKCGLIGTLGAFIGNDHYKTVNTTPESLDIQMYLRKMVDSGCKYAVMEVSSQALKVGRVEGLTFDYGIFTNLSEDHIGENEHKDFLEYRDYKALLFQRCKVGIFNADDINYKKMVEDASCEIKTFGIENTNDYSITHYSFLHRDGKIGMFFNVNGFDFEIFTPGKFSVYNATSAISLGSELGINYETINNTFINFKVKGRVEPVNVSDEFTVLIDYAHEAMSLESLLTTIKEYKPKRIITLFGCGGNRSKLRRYEMGEISGKYSDLTILTEDNSRFEDVLDIIEDIKTGIHKTNGKYVVVPNRKDAIKYAIENALKGDIIILCGKGHEDYQEIKGQRVHMDEREIINEVMVELRLNKN